jgi:hypothetical protein
MVHIVMVHMDGLAPLLQHCRAHCYLVMVTSVQLGSPNWRNMDGFAVSWTVIHASHTCKPLSKLQLLTTRAYLGFEQSSLPHHRVPFSGFKNSQHDKVTVHADVPFCCFWATAVRGAADVDRVNRACSTQHFELLHRAACCVQGRDG